MKKSIFLAVVFSIFTLSVSFAQFDDLYYDPDSDISNSNVEENATYNNNDSYNDTDDGYYEDEDYYEDDYYDDYDYSYSKE